MNAPGNLRAPVVAQSDDLYRTLFENGMAFICIHRLDGTVVVVNPAAAENLGMRPEDAIGHNIKEFLPRGQAVANFDLYLERIRTNGRDAGQMPVRARDGSVRIWSYSNVVIQSPSGEPRVLGHAVDVTDLKRASRELKSSENRYRALFESSNAFVSTHTLDGKILSVNPAVARALGYPAAAAIGHNMQEFQTPEAQANFGAYLEALRTHGHHEDETHFFTIAGEERIWQYSSVVVQPEGGEPYVIAHAVDITEFKRAERALRERADFIRIVLENSSDVVCILEPNGTFRYMSPASKRILGRKREEREGADGFEFMHADDIPRMKAFLQTLREKPGVHPPVEYRVRHADGHWMTLEAIANSRLDDPVIRGIVLNIRDITEYRRAEADRRAAEADRERLIFELQDALGKVKTLTGLLPICSSCKKIRDDRGQWTHVESYIRDRSEAKFTHGICPECAKRLYPEDYKR